MGEVTGIAWTDHTFNPWVGCARVSPGCQHCYAEASSKRWGHDRWGKDAERHVTSDVYWRQPLKWNRQAQAAGRTALVFCASQADVFEDRADLVDARARLWDLVTATPHLIWQLLTKRPENVLAMVPAQWPALVDGSTLDGFTMRFSCWPANVWVGTTVEDQQRAIDRVPLLLEVPAPVRFISCEPLLERVDLAAHWLRPTFPGPRVDWVICGGESGPRHRLLDLDAARSLRDQCARWDVPFFFKQVGGSYATAGGDLLDDVRLKAFPPQAGDRTATPVEVTARG